MASKIGLNQLLLLAKSKQHRIGIQALAVCDHAESSYFFVIRKRRMHHTPVALSPSGGGWKENPDDPHAMFREQMEQLKLEREELFGFTDEERGAWSNLKSSTERLPPSLVASVEEAREQVNKNTSSLAFTDEASMSESSDTPDYIATEDFSQPYHGLTHLSEDGSTATMVDVGHKSITQRTARAQTTVILPPEVIEALHLKTRDEVVGPKGAVFATARIAGIMAAKKTSDLIPLCHPLPLDRVHIDIQMPTNDTILITCECRVSHKTGVEMEALTGASVAALTVYDMLKALSHNIRIEQTVLVSKSGGKRTQRKLALEMLGAAVPSGQHRQIATADTTRISTVSSKGENGQDTEKSRK